MTEAKKTPTYRWSPKPVEQTLRKGINTWCLALTTAQWNIVWLTNPKIATVEASDEWRAALGQSWGCVSEYASLNWRGTLLEAGEQSPLFFRHLLLDGSWQSHPPVFDLIPRLNQIVKKRVALARNDHPSRLAWMIDREVYSLDTARSVLRNYGVKEFKTTY